VGSVAGLLAAAVFLEILLRLVGYGAVSNLGYGPLQNNLGLPELGYAGRPNIDGVQTREGYSRLVLNDQGFHDVNIQREKPAGSFRVAVVGNSFTEAAQVETSETYVSHLERTLSACPALNGRRVEAINLGVAGYTISQNYLLMKEFVWRYSPDFIVLQETPGIEEPEQRYRVSSRVIIGDDGRDHVDSSFMLSKSYQIRSSHVFTLFQNLSDHLRLLQYLNEFRRKAESGQNAKAADGAPRLPASRRGVEQARLLKAIVGISRSHSTPLVLALIPDGESMDPRAPSETPKTEEEKWWQAQSEELGIPFINAATAAWQFARQQHVFLAGFGRQSGRGHLTRSGNAFFGREFGNDICSLVTR
jgi:hypothetical protein